MATPPTNEQGTPGGIRPNYAAHGGGSQTWSADPLERSYDLRFPQSVAVFDRMRSEDGHVGSVLNAVSLSVQRAPWDLDTEGVDERVAAFVRSELGLPAPGEARARRRRHGISWRNHVEQACHMLWAGFAVFEQVYQVGPPNPEQTGMDGEVVHLRKLAPRLARTIQQIETGPDGGLKAVWQKQLSGSMEKPIRLGVERVVVYSHQMEGADWYGRSILRQAYRNWLIKDVLVRLDAQAAERNSMGIPEVTYNTDKPEQKATADAIAQSLRAGESAGVGMPSDMSLNIKGVQGSTVDLVERIKYHDQEITRSALAMVLDLGHDRGAQNLGETFLGMFLDSVQAIADSIAETATEHVVRDLVEWNFGPDEPYPTVTAGDLKAARGISVEDLSALISSGVVRPDDKLEDQQRANRGLPERDVDTARVSSGDASGAETAGALVRAGFLPEDAAAVAGLGELRHSGFPPVTVSSGRETLTTGVQASQPELSGLDEMLAGMIGDYQKRRSRQ